MSDVHNIKKKNTHTQNMKKNTKKIKGLKFKKLINTEKKKTTKMIKDKKNGPKKMKTKKKIK